MALEEIKRLEEDAKREKNWKRWGPYLSERQWATVREDYSADGSSWSFFPHEHSRMRAYRWGEDGILGICDRQCRLCFSFSLWNGKDPILKERMFGLTSTEGNHGEDVKEYYYYLDSTPTHSYMKALYKYPQEAFPYQHLIDENRRRGLSKPEFELWETGVFDRGYYDVAVEYAKQSPNVLLIRLTVSNRGANPADLHLIPTLWYRNTWSWGGRHEGSTDKLTMHLQKEGVIDAAHPTLGQFFLNYKAASDGTTPSPLFTENETNLKKLYGVPNKATHVKDAFHDYVIHQNKEAVHGQSGSKFGAHYLLHLNGGETKSVDLLLYEGKELTQPLSAASFESVLRQRQQQGDAFYAEKIPEALSKDAKDVARRAYAGLLWTKQFYHFVVKEWLEGDPKQPPPPEFRKQGRNKDWIHIYCKDVISMPDKWEYPWFAAWDLAFHMIPFASIDPAYAKKQTILFLREWYMHPNGQQPAYEYEFSDVNPPVHAWAAWRIYKITGKDGQRDTQFLESAFQKLLLNFTWWVNRKDKEGHNLFAGGFLGLDNIGVFDRSQMHIAGAYLEQADGTAWMAFYCLTMLTIALELASCKPAYEDMASKFFEHFVFITDAINEFGGHGLWNEEDGFYYDLLKLPGRNIVIKLRSLVGLIPLLAVEILKEEHIQKLEGFKGRMNWFLKNREDLEETITYCKLQLEKGHRILAIPSKERLVRILRYLFDESEFLSPYGIRSLSKVYEKHPYELRLNNQDHIVRYMPGVSDTYLFGGNSNWRGPIWFPINFLIVEALERYHYYYGDGLKVECPTGSGCYMNLKEAAREISRRLCTLFLPGPKGRPCLGTIKYCTDSHWKDLLLFNEYYHAETGEGQGASHQTGWTALVAKLLETY